MCTPKYNGKIEGDLLSKGHNKPARCVFMRYKEVS